jgi:methylglutaconyl-CoA hydratase
MASIKFTSRDGIARITLDRPERHNAFDDAVIAELAAALQTIASDKRSRVLLLQASGASFSAGADLAWMKRLAALGRAANRKDALIFGRMMQSLAELPIPTIALVQGPAYGGGVGLVAACDFALAVPGARFLLSEVKLGLIPAIISPYVVRAVGPAAAKRLFLGAAAIGAAEALRLDLISAIVAETDLAAEGERLAESLRANAPEAMAEAKKLVGRVAFRPITTALVKETAELIAARRASAEGREGLATFLEKRKPVWPVGARAKKK